MSEPLDPDRPAPAAAAFVPVSVTRVGRAGRGKDGPAADTAAVEEPLEVRLHGRPFAVVMRTPGDDRELAAGFLFAEGVVQSADEIGAIEHCRHPDRPEVHNLVDVYLLGPARAALDQRLAARRNVVTSAACGMCGRVTIEALQTRAAPIADRTRMTRAVAASLPEILRRRQRVFEDTGGLHAAGLFDAAGVCMLSREDVGRHNAVDKIVGAMLVEGRLPLAAHALAVSGRTSFEIVQKAWLAGIGLLCAVSAPSSLAIELAEAAGITLLGFVRGGGFNVYSHPNRIADIGA
jgi:FdhD protein